MGEGAPAVAGLAVGIAFVVAFSVFAGSMFGGSGSEKMGRIIITIDNLKSTYEAGEPISFTVSTEGVSNNLCNDPKPGVRIVGDDGRVWSSPSRFQTVMLCPLQEFDTEWRFGYPGEELPYGSAIGYQPYDNNIVIEKAGLYNMIVDFDDHVIEKEFSVINQPTVELTIDGLKDTYKVGEIIYVTATQKGGGCATPQIIIMDENQQIVLVSKNDAEILCQFLEDREGYHFSWTPSNHGSPIMINQTGTYTLVAEYGTERVEQKFAVIG